MANADSIAFTRLADGTLLQRDADGAFRPVASQSDPDRLAALTEQEVEAMASSDPDHPGLDAAFWANLEDSSAGKEAISIKIDRDVLGFFRKGGKGYQTRINAVLRSYMKAKEHVG